MNPSRLNEGLDHLSSIKIGEELMNIKDVLPDAQLFRTGMVNDYYEKRFQFLVAGTTPEWFTTNQKKHSGHLGCGYLVDC